MSALSRSLRAARNDPANHRGISGFGPPALAHELLRVPEGVNGSQLVAADTPLLEQLKEHSLNARITFGPNLGLTHTVELEDSRHGRYVAHFVTLWRVHVILSLRA